MKLDKYSRQGIVSHIMSAVPEKDDDVVQAEVQAALCAAMPVEVFLVYQKYPRALSQEASYGLSRRCVWLYKGGLSEEDYVRIIKPWSDAHLLRESAQAKLNAVVNGCTTLKQLRTRLPEFVQYMPEEETATRNLPAIANLVADLVHLGWAP